ncbi:MAG TPA: ammonium transporter [Pseudonocardiaceae bacterium]
MIDTGDTAWVLVSAALVMLMTPGLALFYGGMVRAKSVLNMMMMSFVSLAVVGVLWVIYGFSLAFDNDAFGGLVGGVGKVGMHDVIGAVAGTIPLSAFAMFQLMFAIITAALLAGAVADRTRFWPWVLFLTLWATFVYFPVAHWTFAVDGVAAAHGGWIVNGIPSWGYRGALDFAGGTAVEINSGFSALALALVLGRRRGWPGEPMRPHNMPAVLLGAGLLWFGWFGFNAGSALSAGELAATAFTATMTASAAGVLAWLLTEQVTDGRPTTLGAASGAIAGLVGITPACGFVDPLGALLIGAVAGAVCALAVRLKFRFRFDDSLDVLALHGVAGLLGTLMIGLVATTRVNKAGGDGLFYGGGWSQLGVQAVAAFATLVYVFLATFVLAIVVKRIVGLRVDPETEADGIDEAEHAETAYDFSSLSGGSDRRERPRKPLQASAQASAGTEG